MYMFPVYCVLFCSIIWPTLLAFVTALQEEEENIICDSCRPEWGGLSPGYANQLGASSPGGYNLGCGIISAIQG